MKFQHYLTPETVEEALALAQKPNTVILGGMMWLHLQNRTVENAVDLSHLGLDRIEETDDGIRIGASVTLRALETSETLLRYTHGAVAEALSPIVGVQFRNTATVGGSIFGRFGFSDVATLFSSLGAKVCLAGAGEIPMTDFIRDGVTHDVLTYIVLPKETPNAVVSLAHRNTATDFPVVTVALCQRGDRVRVTVTPAPMRGYTSDYPIAEKDAIAERFVSETSFRGDRAATAEYREHLAKVLIRRALEKIGG